MKTLVVGLGNPILGDDGVGWMVAREIEKRLYSPATREPKLAQDRTGSDTVIECLALGGIALMEHMVGYERVILIDSLNTGQQPQGKLNTFSLDLVGDRLYGHSASAHDLSLSGALKLGRSLGADLPADENITVITIEANHIYDFTEDLTPSIARAVPLAVKTALNIINQEI